MAKKRLRWISAFQFVKGMLWPDRVMLLIFWVAIAVMAAGTLVSGSDPAHWSLQEQEVSEPFRREVLVDQPEANHRHMEVRLGAYTESVTYFAGAIRVPHWSVWLYLYLTLLAWAAISGSATYFKSYAAYVVGVLPVIFWAVSGAFEYISGEEKWKIMLGLWALFYFGFFYLLHSGRLKIPLYLRILGMGALFFLPVLIGKSSLGFHGAHELSVRALSYIAILVVIWLAFIAKDLTSFIYLVATNAKNKKWRLAPIWISTLNFLLIFIEFIMLQDAMGWGIFPQQNIELRPIYFVVFAGVVTLITSQNIYPAIKDEMPNRAFTLLLAGLSLLGFTTLFYHFTAGEFLLVGAVERVAIILFTVTGLAHFFYTMYNFGALLRARVNFYYLSMLPRRLMYFFVVIATVAGFMVLEASQRFKDKTLLNTSFYNRMGDTYFEKGARAEAMANYGFARDIASGTVKGNYNYAFLQLSFNGDLEEVREKYKAATSFYMFPPAYLNQANLSLMEVDYKKDPYGEAKDLLMEGTARQGDPYLYNNLALFWLKLNEPDSAIIALKEGMRLNEDLPGLYANLGSLYLDYDKPEFARKFFAAGLETGEVHAPLLANALYYNLMYHDSLEVADSLLHHPAVKEDFALRMNFALYHYGRGDNERTQAILDTLIAEKPHPDLYLLDALLKFRMGEIDLAVSRFVYLGVEFPAYKAIAEHYLAVCYFSAEVPEMAAIHFKKAAELGYKPDLLQAALMEIDAGNQDSAYAMLSRARVQDQSLWTEAGKEIGMLLYSRGQKEIAMLEMEPSNLSNEEWARMGLYAARAGMRLEALDIFRTLSERDSSTLIPYIEMGRIGLADDDPFVMENLDAGLKRAPGNVELLTLKGLVYLRQGKLAEARSVAGKLSSGGGNPMERARFDAGVSLASGDTVAAISRLREAHAVNPLYTPVIVQLGGLYLRTGEIYEGHDMVFKAIERNERSADLWELLARYELGISRLKECGFAAVKAIELYESETMQDSLSREFSREIRIFREGLSEDEFYE